MFWLLIIQDGLFVLMLDVPINNFQSCQDNTDPDQTAPKGSFCSLPRKNLVWSKLEYLQQTLKADNIFEKKNFFWLGPVNSFGHVRRSVHRTTLFSWASLTI